MTSFIGLLKLTCRSALRSRIFQLLLLLLIICIAAIPNTIMGDGTAIGYIQISLKYSLGAVSFVLGLATIWLSASIMTQDLESYQIHMLVVKPVSRLKIWLAKFTGVILLNAVLLLIASLIVYALINWQFSHHKFSDVEKMRIQNEVLVGRKVFFPKAPNIDELVKQEYQKRIAAAAAAGAQTDSSAADIKNTMRELRRIVIAGMSEVKFGMDYSRIWEYEGLPKELKAPLYLRYRMYIDKISASDQRPVFGIWSVRIYVPEKEFREQNEAPKNIFEKASEDKLRSVIVPKSEYPEEMNCGIFCEITLAPIIISPEGTAEIGFTNFDKERKAVYFQASDGPKLLIKVTSFFNNYCRAVLMIFLKIVTLAALSCAAASLFYMPTAIFSVISYLFFGAVISFIGDIDTLSTGTEFTDLIAYYLGNFITAIVIPMQKFETSMQLAGGELIELSYMLKVFLIHSVLKGLPLVLIGIWFYKRRELGLVVRK